MHLLNSLYSFWILALLALSFNSNAQISPILKKIVPNQTDTTILRLLPICEAELKLERKYALFDAKDLVQELIKEDSSFTCPGIRGTIRNSGKRAVIRSLISQNGDEALPYLIKVIKKEEPPLSSLALELAQHADDQLLKSHRTLFLKKSQSKHPGERNRSLYILQRIKDQHIEEVMVTRWNELSKKEIEQLSNTGSFGIWFELMLYGIKDRTLVEKSVISTLREKKLKPNGLSVYLRVVESIIHLDHDAQIDEEVVEILMKTKDPTVANYAAAVLSDSRTSTAMDGLIQALNRKDPSIRARVAHNLISRSDFEITEQKNLLERILADHSKEVIQQTLNTLIWKKPDATQSAIIIKCLLKHLSESETPLPQKAYLLMYFYPKLNETMRNSITISDPSLVLQSIDLALNSSEYNRGCKIATENLFEQIHGKKEMDITHLEFWRRQFEH